VAELEALAQAHPRYGYRRAWAVLRRTRTVNRKRIHRLWKRAKLQVKRVRRARSRRERPPPLAAAYPQHVWAYDFVQDQDRHGNTLYILTVMDEFTFLWAGHRCRSHNLSRARDQGLGATGGEPRCASLHSQ